MTPSYEELWETIVAVRDTRPRTPNDAPTDEIVDALLAGPLAPLLAKLRAVGELADEWTRVAHDHDGITATVYRQNADRLRHALDAS